MVPSIVGDRHVPSVAHIQELRAIASDYTLFLIDLWGVMHNGLSVFGPAHQCLRQLRAKGKNIIFLSNAPRRADIIRHQLSTFGISARDYDAVLSSGEDAWQHLHKKEDSFYASLQKRCFMIGPKRDAGMMEGLDITPVSHVADADFILNSGPWGDTDTVEDYHDTLKQGAASGLAMICLNPDLEVIRGEKRIICAGALAQAYQTMGGAVRYHGKPYAGIYQRALKTIPCPAKKKILAIGDSLRTDIKGARDFGIDSLLVLSGIHRSDTGTDQGRREEFRQHLWQKNGIYPDRTIDHLCW